MSLLFGAPQATPQQPAANNNNNISTPAFTMPTMTSGSSTAGATIMSTGGGLNPATNVGFNFGAAQPATQPAATAAPPAFTGFGGTSSGAVPNFGVPGTGTVPSFGTPAATTAPTFGATTTSTVPTFGAPLTTTAATTFGIPAASTLGTPAGAAAATTTAPASFGFGTPAPSTITAASQPAATPVTTSTPFGFGAPSATPLGTGTTTTTTSTTTAPLTFGFNTTSSQPTTTTASSTVGATTASTVGSGLSFGFGTGLAAAAPPAGTVLGGAQTLTNFGGLGGIPSSANTESSLGLSSGMALGGKGDIRALKEQSLPVELLVLIDELKSHMRSEKIKLGEITRTGDKFVEKVAEELEETRHSISNFSNLVHRQALACEAFQKELVEEQNNLEMAMITRETPLALQNEITQPMQYFNRMLNSYQNRMLTYRREILRAESTLSSMSDVNGVSSKELGDALKGSKDTVVALAAKVQDLHETLADEITIHGNLQRFIFGESKFQIDSNSAKTKTNLAAANLHSSLDRAYEKANVLFHPNKFSEVNKLFCNQPTPTKGTAPSNILSSTPIFSRPVINMNKPQEPINFNSTGFGSPTLFQTQTSAILASQLQSPSPQSGASLKRSKR